MSSLNYLTLIVFSLVYYWCRWCYFPVHLWINSEPAKHLLFTLFIHTWILIAQQSNISIFLPYASCTHVLPPKPTGRTAVSSLLMGGGDRTHKHSLHELIVHYLFFSLKSHPLNFKLYMSKSQKLLKFNVTQKFWI